MGGELTRSEAYNAAHCQLRQGDNLHGRREVGQCGIEGNQLKRC